MCIYNVSGEWNTFLCWNSQLWDICWLFPSLSFSKEQLDVPASPLLPKSLGVYVLSWAARTRFSAGPPWLNPSFKDDLNASSELVLPPFQEVFHVVFNNFSTCLLSYMYFQSLSQLLLCAELPTALHCSPKSHLGVHLVRSSPREPTLKCELDWPSVVRVFKASEEHGNHLSLHSCSSYV